MPNKTEFLLIVLISVLFSFYLINSVRASSVMLDLTYGGSGEDQARSIIKTSDEGYVIAGYTSSFGAGETDFWLMKIDSNGNMLWNKTYGGLDDDGSVFGVDLVETSDGGYALTGHTRSFSIGETDFWLVKVDSSGIMEWNQTYGGTNQDVASSLVEVTDGGYALAGHTWSYGSGFADFWLIRTDLNGNILWNQTFGGTAGDDAYSLVETSDGGFAITGYTSSFGAGGSDFWLVKVDSSGVMEWNQTYGGTSNEIANSLLETSDGGFALAGYTSSFGGGWGDFWLVKTDSSGVMEWNQTYGGVDWERGFSMISTSDGGYALTGQTSYLGNPISSDYFFVKTNGSGNIEWSKVYGDYDYFEIAYSLVENSDKGYTIVGEKNKDLWLIKTDEYGVIPEFSSWMLLPLFLGVSIVALVSRKYLRKQS